MIRESGAYGAFARHYDVLMRDAPYAAWRKWFDLRVGTPAQADTVLVDLGCGTGTMTEHFLEQGYRVIAIDPSAEMLSILAEKLLPKYAQRLTLVEQQAQSLELPEKVDLIVSFCDSLSYLLDDESVREAMRRSFHALKPGGRLLFDLHSVHYLSDVVGDAVYYDLSDEVSYIWETNWNAEDQTCDSSLTLFESLEGDLYRRTVEFHRQRGHEAARIKKLVSEAGFTQCEVTADFDSGAPGPDARRLFLDCQKG